MKHPIINCDLPPFVPEGFTLLPDSEQLPNRTKGKVKFDISKVELYLSEKQKTGYIKGEELLRELKPKTVLTSHFLKYFLDNPELIPEEWKGKYIYFWGTLLRNPGGRRSVLYFYWFGGRWSWVYSWLDSDWHDDSLSAGLANSSLPSKPLDYELRLQSLEDFKSKVEKVLRL